MATLEEDHQVESWEDFVILKNEAAKWIEDTICQTIPDASLEDVLQNGVVLERLSRILQARYNQWSCQLKEISHEAMLRPSKAASAASARTQYDVNKFFKFCRDLGVPDAQVCKASDIIDPTPSATLRGCVTLYGTWQVCVQRGIDYGEYFHHGTKMKLLSTKAPLKPSKPQVKKDINPVVIYPNEPLPPPNMKPHPVQTTPEPGKKAAKKPAARPKTPPPSTASALSMMNHRARRSPGPDDNPVASAAALPLRPLGMSRPAASSTMSTGYNSSVNVRSVSSLSPSPSADPHSRIEDLADDFQRKQMGSPMTSSPPKRKSPYFSKLRSPPIPRFPYHPSYEPAEAQPKSRGFPGVRLLWFTAKVAGVVALARIAVDTYDQHYAGFQRMQERRQRQREAILGE